MPRVRYVDKNLSSEKLKVISAANLIIAEYESQGFDLTLRQMYYQFVSRGLFANSDKNYKWLGTIIADARLAGLIDWLSIVDRTRFLEANQHWDKPSDIISHCAKAYQTNKWETQPEYCEVWIEKDALKGVIAGICSQLDVPYFSCRGYTSLSELWSAGMRIKKKINAGKTAHVIHLGDHDPSGIDMSRDIKERLEMFIGSKIHVLRIALNMSQVQRYNPPPNPAKTTDSRFQNYVQKYGNESWELDALDPRVIVVMIKKAVGQFRDEALWREAVSQEQRGKTTLDMLIDNFTSVVAHLRSLR